MKKHQLFKKIQTPNNINHIIEYSSVKVNNYSEQNFHQHQNIPEKF